MPLAHRILPSSKLKVGNGVVISMPDQIACTSKQLLEFEVFATKGDRRTIGSGEDLLRL